MLSPIALSLLIPAKSKWNMIFLKKRFNMDVRRWLWLVGMKKLFGRCKPIISIYLSKYYLIIYLSMYHTIYLIRGKKRLKWRVIFNNFQSSLPCLSPYNVTYLLRSIFLVLNLLFSVILQKKRFSITCL